MDSTSAALSAPTTGRRPVTSKARGICRYWTTPRGCFAGDRCKFLHASAEAVDQEKSKGKGRLAHQPDAGVTNEAPSGSTPPLLTPYDKAKRCRYFDQGFCKRGENCWFLHKAEKERAAPEEDEDDEFCSICFEQPATYGLLGGCSHIFCINCIKQWRDPQNKAGGVLESGNTKKCPMCRAPSRFITPSSKFWKEGTEEKTRVTTAYKESMARVPCKYFQRSMLKNKDSPICPYGRDCFYQHLKEDGTPFIFRDGVDVCMRKFKTSMRRGVLFDELRFIPVPLPYGIMRVEAVVGSNATGSNTGANTHANSNRLRDGNGVVYAARRLREVGRSLEMLNEAISEGATLENLNFAVEALRVGLGRLEGDAVEDRPPYRRRADRVPSGDGQQGDREEQQEDEVMERLEILADQMLASITALRSGASSSRAESPPPPLVPLEGYTQALQSERERLQRAMEADVSDSDSDMPWLASISNTSDEEGGEDEDEVAVEEENALVSGLIESWVAASRADVPERAPSPESRASARFSTVVDRPPSVIDSDDDVPPLEPVEPPEGGDKRPSGGAFTTDGRGRVISVGDTPAEGGAVTEEAAESSVSSAPSAGSSGRAERSILGWIGTLF